MKLHGKQACGGLSWHTLPLIHSSVARGNRRYANWNLRTRGTFKGSNDDWTGKKKSKHVCGVPGQVMLRYEAGGAE